MKKLLFGFLIITLIIGFSLPNFIFAQKSSQVLEIPSNLNDIVAIGNKIVHFPFQIFSNIWQEVWGIWMKIFTFAKNIWDNDIFPEIDDLWHRILSVF
jgi:hypothetical protein